MSILILNRLPAFLTDYPKWLYDYKDEIHLFTQNKHLHNYKGLSFVQGFDDYINNPEIEHQAVELHKVKPFDAVIALDEVDIIRAAKIREILNINGQDLNSSNFYRDKVVMKNTLCNHINVPNYSRIFKKKDIYSFINENGFPIVIKPIDGMGGMNTFIIKSLSDLKKTLEIIDLSSFNYMVESFINGEMFSIDGLLVNNKIEFCSVSKYHNSVLGYMNNIGHSLEILSPQEKVYKELKAFIKNLFQHSPNPNIMVFHCEVFLNDNKDIIFCEIASRLGGARIPELIKQSYGVNLEEIYIRLTCNLNVNFPINNKMLKHTGVYLIPKYKGELISSIEKFPFSWVTEYQPYLKVGMQSNEAISSSDIFGTVVFEADSRSELLERLEILEGFTQKGIIWR